MVDRVRALAPEGVDLALDVAGSGVLPELIELAGGPEHVVTIADFRGAQEYGVTFIRGDAGRALYVLSQIGELVESGRFTLPEVQTFPLADVAQAHRVSENGHVRASHPVPLHESRPLMKAQVPSQTELGNASSTGHKTPGIMESPRFVALSRRG